MFGIYRLLLALFVVVGHLYGPSGLGSYAVFGFYVLSGYLMTYVMNNSYGYNYQGRKRFLLNRILRIYPAYYIAISISIIILVIYGDQITYFKPSIFLPSTLEEFLQNIFIIFPGLVDPRLSPPTWALSVELFFYLLICLGVSKKREMTWIWVAISLMITIISLLQGEPWEKRYFPLSAASLPFAIGSAIYYHRGFLLRKFHQVGLANPILWFFAICLNFSVGFIGEIRFELNWIFFEGFYLNLLLVSCCLISLINYQTSRIPRQLDSLLGKFSYPIYLVHWQCGAIVYAISEHYLSIQFMTSTGIYFLILSIVLSFAVSYLIIKLIDEPLEKFRNQIREKTLRMSH